MVLVSQMISCTEHYLASRASSSHPHLPLGPQKCWPPTTVISSFPVSCFLRLYIGSQSRIRLELLVTLPQKQSPQRRTWSKVSWRYFDLLATHVPRLTLVPHIHSSDRQVGGGKQTAAITTGKSTTAASTG